MGVGMELLKNQGVSQGHPSGDVGKKICVLVVMPEDRRLSLSKHLESCAMVALPVRNCREALAALQTIQVEVIITDPTLPDGNWVDLLAAADRCHSSAEIVICMRKADHRQWIDALEGGAYDVLAEPYREDEVKRIVEGAALKSRMPRHAQPGVGRCILSLGV